METQKQYEIIIIGGSFAGLSAALALGRSLRKVLIVDSRQPCNRQTPFSHNFLTRDGEPPLQILDKARQELKAYPTLDQLEDMVRAARPDGEGFLVETASGKQFHGRKLLFATGVKDLLPDIPGYASSWGISVLHCPYCHGYEVSNKPTGLLADGDDMAFEKAKMVAHWTKELVFLTNGNGNLTEEQRALLVRHSIAIIEKEIGEIVEEKGYISRIDFTDGSSLPLRALYARPAMAQQCTLPEMLGCALTEGGYIETDDFKRTSVPGIYAAGDNTTMFRSVATAVAAGSLAGAMINKDLIDESF